MRTSMKLLSAVILAASASAANAQYPQQPPAPVYAAPVYAYAPPVKARCGWSPFAWLCRPAPLNAPSVKKPEYPLGFPQSPYVRSPRDFFMAD